MEWKNPHTGEVLAVPANIDPGFAYNVGQARMRWKGLLDAVAGRIVRLPAIEGAALFESLDDVALGKVAEVFAGFFEQAMAGPPAGRFALAGIISRRILERMAEAGVLPASAEIMCAAMIYGTLCAMRKPTPSTELGGRNCPCGCARRWPCCEYRAHRRCAH